MGEGGGGGGREGGCFQVTLECCSAQAVGLGPSGSSPAHSLGDSFDSLRLLSDSYDYLRLLSDSFDSLRLLSDSYDYLVHVGPSPVTSKVVQRTGAMVPRLGGMT